MSQEKIKSYKKVIIFLFLSAACLFYSQADQAPEKEIFAAAEKGNLEKVQELVEKDPELVNIKDAEDETPLHKAAAAGHVAVVEFLLAKGADIDAWNNARQNPLLHAAYYGKAQVVKLLLDNGANIKERDRYGRTVLHYPVRAGHRDVVEILVGKGMDITAEDGMGVSPLRFAIEGGHAGIMEVFIMAGALDVGSDPGRFALHLAASQGQKEIADILIEKKASMRTKDDGEATLLHNAAIGGLPELARLSIEDGALLNARDARGRTPLHYAVKKGSPDIVELLVKKGADLDIKGKDERTALHIAEDWGYEEIIRLLKSKGASEIPRLTPRNPDNPWVGITYISNDGFLISSETKRILVDSLIKNPYGYSNTPEKVFENMVKSRAPFDRIDLLLFSHAHRDHFEPEMAVNLLINHPETVLVGNDIVYRELKEAAGDDFSGISPRVKNINPGWGTVVEETIGGVEMKIFQVNHGLPENPYVTLAFLMDMDGATVLHMGDIYAPANEEYFRAFQLQEMDIVVAFIDPFFLLDKTGMQMTKEFIRPKKIVPMHMRVYEIGKYVQALKDSYTNIYAFRECLEKKYFEDF